MTTGTRENLFSLLAEIDTARAIVGRAAATVDPFDAELMRAGIGKGLDAYGHLALWLARPVEIVEMAPIWQGEEKE